MTQDKVDAPHRKHNGIVLNVDHACFLQSTQVFYYDRKFRRSSHFKEEMRWHDCCEFARNCESFHVSKKRDFFPISVLDRKVWFESFFQQNIRFKPDQLS